VPSSSRPGRVDAADSEPAPARVDALPLERATATIPDRQRRPDPEVVEAFLAAARDGDFDALIAVLDADVVRRVDTGQGTIVEMRGAQNVARRALTASQLGLEVRLALINGAHGWVSLLHGNLYAVGALTIQSGRIKAIDILRDPTRLAQLDVTFLDSPP
jgi:limonene-1,2-epoxide hydrolase